MEPLTIHADHRYRIRAFAAWDVTEHHSAVATSIAELSAWMPWCSPAYARADSEQFLCRCASAWNDGSEYHFGVFDAATDGVLGVVAVGEIRQEAGCANLAYWTRTIAARRGIATLAARAAAIFAIRRLGLARLEIIVHPENAASRRVAEKLGCRFEGMADDRMVFHGEPRTAAVYSLTAEDVQGWRFRAADVPRRQAPPFVRTLRPVDGVRNGVAAPIADGRNQQQERKE